MTRRGDTNLIIKDNGVELQFKDWPLVDKLKICFAVLTNRNIDINAKVKYQLGSEKGSK